MTAISKTQTLFDMTCRELGFSTSWNIDDHTAPWQEFAVALFLKRNFRTRSKTKLYFDDHWRVYAGIELLMDFYHIDVDGEEMGSELLLKQAIGLYADRHNLSEERVSYSYEWVKDKMRKAPWVFKEWEHKPKGTTTPAWRLAQRKYLVN